MEKLLWKNKYYDYPFLIDKENVKERALVSDTLIIENVDATVEDLQKRISEIDGIILDAYEMEEFLENIGLKNAAVSSSDEYPELENKIAFDCIEQQFFNLKNSKTIKIFEWFDGKHFRTVSLNMNTIETAIVISDSYVDLNEWGGHAEEIGEYQRVYKILEINGSNVQGKDMYLLNRCSKQQGSYETGEVMNLAELQHHLKNSDKDVAKYMFEIRKLSCD